MAALSMQESQALLHAVHGYICVRGENMRSAT